jgi:hypothetical protein
MTEYRLLDEIDVKVSAGTFCTAIHERISALAPQLDADELQEFRARMRAIATRADEFETPAVDALYDHELRCWELSLLVGRSERWEAMLANIVPADGESDPTVGEEEPTS